MANILWISTISVHDELNDAAKQVRNMLTSLAQRRARVLCLTASIFTSMDQYALSPVLTKRIEEETNTPDLTFNVVDNGVAYLYCKTKSYALSNMSTQEQRFFVGQMFPLIAQFKPDLVITSCSDIVAMSCLNMAKTSGIPTSYVLNEPVSNEFVFQDIDLILSTTQSLTDDFVTPLGRSAIQIGNFLPVGKDDVSSRLSKLDDAKALAKKKQILFVSPTPDKGLGVFLRIVEKARHHEVLKDYSFSILERESNQLNLALEALKDPNASEGKVNLDDYKDIKVMNSSQDIDSVLGNVRLMVMPTLSYASTSESALKALNHGVPVITTDQPNLRELLSDGASYIEMKQEVIDTNDTLPDMSEADIWIEHIVNMLNDEEAPKRALMASTKYNYEASTKRLAMAIKPLTDMKSSNNPQLFRSGPYSLRLANESEMEANEQRKAASERENTVKDNETKAVAESKAEITS